MEITTALLIIGSVIAAGTIYLLALRFAQGLVRRIFQNFVILPAKSLAVPEVAQHLTELVPAKRLEETVCVAAAPIPEGSLKIAGGRSQPPRRVPSSGPSELPPLFLIGTALIAVGLGLKLRPASRRPPALLAADR